MLSRLAQAVRVQDVNFHSALGLEEVDHLIELMLGTDESWYCSHRDESAGIRTLAAA
jgi:hypothetical protein